MAYGDLIGDVSQAYMTNAERAARHGVQSITGGPIARASGQVATGLAAGAGLAASATTPAGMNPNPQHLGDIFKSPAQLAQPPQPASLASALPVGVTPTATSPTYPTNSQAMASLSDGLKQSSTVSPPGIQQPQNIATAGANTLNLNPVPTVSPVAVSPEQPQGLDDLYRTIGGSGIAGRVGANGTAEFTNAPSDLRSAGGLQPVSRPATPSLADAANYTAASSGPQFAALGSASNLGDGIGTFSQAQAGDAQLAMGRFQKAADLRDAYKAQDKLQEAQAAQTRDNNFTVVHDSSQPVTRREIKFDQDRASTTQSLADAVNLAQSGIAAQRQGVAADQQQRQANRLEDIMTAAQSPNATPEQVAAGRRVTDPDGSKAASLQLTQAKTQEAIAAGKKLAAEAGAVGGPGKLTEGQGKDLQYFARANAANAELSKNGSALTTAETGDRSVARGRTDAFLRGLPKVGDSALVNSLVSNERQLAEQSGSELVNAILRKDSGAALTPDEVANYGKTYLPQPGDGEAVLKQKQEARTRAIQGIKDGLGSAAILAGEVNRPEYKAQGAPTPASAQSPKRYSFAEASALPAGTEFTDSNGVVRIKH